jgi:hypothetical protein
LFLKTAGFRGWRIYKVVGSVKGKLAEVLSVLVIGSP